jgi:RHS repeat-associated protein
LQVVSYQYDANSNRTQLSLNAATSATYQYDVINRLIQLTHSGTLNTTFSYDATDKLTSRTLPSGVVSTWDYDGLNRLTRLKHVKGVNTLADFQYQFNAVNNITQMIDGDGGHNYSYDPLDRITAATHPNQPNESYTYDDVGNRIGSNQGSSYTYQPFNQLVAANGSTFGYDTNGNLIAKTDATGNWIYTWDYENRLKQVSLPNGSNVTYQYDALDRLVQRISSSSGTIKFVYDATDVIRDVDAGGNILANYMNGLEMDNKIGRQDGQSGAISYFLADSLGSTRALVDSSGILTETLTLDSFGNGSSISTRYRFTGREIDESTGLLFYRARWYDPSQGRFASEDPVGIDGGVNWYSYVENNPTNFDDPFGLTKLPRSRTGTRPCNAAEEAECIKMCGPKGMESCRVSRTFRVVRAKGHLRRYDWVDGPLSCSCNDCDPPAVPVPVPVPKSERDTDAIKKRQKNFTWRPGVLVPTMEEQQLMLRNAAGAATLTLVLMMMLMLAAL